MDMMDTEPISQCDALKKVQIFVLQEIQTEHFLKLPNFW